MVADAGSLNTSLVWAPQDIYRSYGGSTGAASGRPLLVKFNLDAVPNFAGSTINRAELRFYTWGGNSGMYNTGYITFSDWIEGTCSGGFPGATGGVSGAHPMGYNTGAYQTADGTPVNLGSPANTALAPCSWANGLPFDPAKDGVAVVHGLAHNFWGVTPGTNNQYLTIDITPILQLWASGLTNYGLFVDTTGNYGPAMSETTAADHQPTLFIQYYTPIPDPTAPSTPQLGSPSATAIQIVTLGTDNDATTPYAVQEATTGQYVGPDGRLQADPFWQQRQDWSDLTISGLTSQTTYMFKSQSRNQADVESAYSSVSIVTTSIAGDINGDALVNVGDLQSLVAAWGSTSDSGPGWNPGTDLNGDTYVNIGDLQILIANWASGLE